MLEQVRRCSVWPGENWFGSSLNQIQGWVNDLNMLLSCFREKIPEERVPPRRRSITGYLGHLSSDRNSGSGERVRVRVGQMRFCYFSKKYYRFHFGRHFHSDMSRVRKLNLGWRFLLQKLHFFLAVCGQLRQTFLGTYDLRSS